jgi:hypothetical protein
LVLQELLREVAGLEVNQLLPVKVVVLVGQGR